MPKNVVNVEDVEKKSKVRKPVPIDWDAIAVRIGVIASFITFIAFLISVMVFLWNFHTELVSLSLKVGRIEGQVNATNSANFKK